MGGKVTKIQKRRPRLESVVKTRQTSNGFVIYSTPTEGYNITHGLQTYDSGNNLGLLCVTSLHIIHQSNTLARLEIPLANIINIKSRLCQMNFMTYPNEHILSIKCRLDEEILCVNFKVDSPDQCVQEIEKARSKLQTPNNNNFKRSSNLSTRSSKLAMTFKQQT